MTEKVIAGLLVVALAAGCARVALLPDEHLWAEGHKVSVPQLPPVPSGSVADAGAATVQVVAYIVGVDACFQGQFGVGKLVGKKVGRDEIQAIIRAAEGSAHAIVISSPHLTAVSGLSDGLDLTTHGTYVSDYTLTNGIYVPIVSEWMPQNIALRLKATAHGDTVAFEDVAVLFSDCFLVQCSATFGIPAAPKASNVTLNWFEPIQETHMASLKDSVRLKVNEATVFELPGVLERGVSNLRVLLKSSDIREKGYRRAGDAAGRLIYYAIIMPELIVPAVPKTAMIAH